MPKRRNRPPYEIPADVQEIKEEIRHTSSVWDLLESDAASRMVALEDCMELKNVCFPSTKPSTAISPSGTSSPRLSATRLPCVNIRRRRRIPKAGGMVSVLCRLPRLHGKCGNSVEQKTYMGQLLRVLSPLYDQGVNIMTPSVPLWMPLLQGESRGFYRCFPESLPGAFAVTGKALYGKYFPELAEWIGQKRMVLPHKLSDEELANFYEELKGNL